MKQTILCCLLIASSFVASAQDRAKDEKQINDQIDSMIADWNRHNFDNLSRYTTADFDWVNIVGHWWKGQKQNKFGLEAFHNSFFKNTPQKKSQTHVRFVTNDVAIVHLFWSVGAFYPPDGVNRGTNKMGDDKELATLVTVKQNGKWLITAGQNIVINEDAEKSNPVNYMPKE
ncbi:SgcJ/EcaC family oxidoreductase [Segetibacter aerophilus]|nr:SgcJ/EcaC family oxidoreductase [Segetibacter aerophilus]